MKKYLLPLTAAALFVLGGCTNKEAEQKVTEQSKTIESLEKTIESLNKEQGDMITLKKGEGVTLSGTFVIGEDLEPGAYDITLPGNEDAAFSLFKDQEAKDNMKYDHEWLFPAKDGKAADELKSYSLKKGNILELSGNLDFTKVR